MSNAWPPRRVHIVGVGGTGMSGVARYLAERGCDVSGSDGVDGASLQALGDTCDVRVGIHPELAAEADIVTMSPAVSLDHPELVAAREAGVAILGRSEFLARICADHEVVAIAGTHGKTTTTSMYVAISHAAGRHDSWLLGAPIRGVGANGHFAGRHLILELDESYGTLATIEPTLLGLLNVEADHLDHYGSLENLQRAFYQLVARTKSHVVVWEDGTAHQLVRTVASVVTVGESSTAMWRVESIERSLTASSFMLRGPNVTLACRLAVPGQHNIENAAVAAVTALLDGIAPDHVERGLAAFCGAPRRFESHGMVPDSTTWVIEDFAHLPGELATTIATARDGGATDIVAVFQPHRITRTTFLADEFGRCFSGLRELVVLDIYAAGEPNPDGVTGELVAEAVKRHSDVPVRYIATRQAAMTYLQSLAVVPEGFLVLGAGDVGEMAEWLVGR